MPASRTTSSHGFTVVSERTTPVAIINPGSQVRVIGSAVSFDGRASYSDDGGELTYTWSVVSSPMGSQVTSLTEVNDEGVVQLSPDVIGLYTIGLVVATAYLTSAIATATVHVQAALVPYTGNITPDASWIFDIIGDVWSVLDKRTTFSTMWSAYIQQSAGDMLRYIQNDYAKSIATIQELYQRRWLLYEPRLDLEESYGIFGYEQAGVGAFTSDDFFAGTGIIVSSTEFILFDGSPTSKAVGSSLRVVTSHNVGTYTINRMNSDSSGYIVSSATPFPVPASDLVCSSTDLVSSSLSNEVYSVATDFAAAGVVAGDILRIEEGSDIGFHVISAVGIAGGLVNDRTLQLESNTSVTVAGLSFSVFRSVRAYFQTESSPTTDTVYIPESEADFTIYEQSSRTGVATIRDAYELEVEPRHVYKALEGRTITIFSGNARGRKFSVASVNSSASGYILSSPLLMDIGSEVKYEVPAVSGVYDRLIFLDGRAHRVSSAYLDSAQPSVSEGGRGPVWVIRLHSDSAPSGRDGMSWRVGHTLVFPDVDDLEEHGVNYGDLLVLEITREDNSRVAEVPCYVLGSDGGYLAFSLSAEPLQDSVPADISGEEIYSLTQDLLIPSATLDGSTVTLDLAATEIELLLQSLGFRSTYYNSPIYQTTSIDLDLISVRVAASHVIRNTRIPVDDSLVSVPYLIEYIKNPDVGADSDGNVFLVSDDNETSQLDRLPLSLVENRDFSISPMTISGTNAQTVAGSVFITIPYGDLGDRDVVEGDEIELTSGLDQGRYTITMVVDPQTLKVRYTGGVPSHTAANIEYTIYRRFEGNYIRFAPGTFYPSYPAPERLWAETSFFDNSDYIEDNFGVLVNVTKDQLDEYGSAQVTYKGVVSGLMYAWTTGSTVTNATIGSHLLLGLPVTEHLGRVIEVFDEWSDLQGRILIEDINEEGAPTGLIRPFFYDRGSDDSVLDIFRGIATNPDTGLPYDLGDIVPPFRSLSKAALVYDYINNPTWWYTPGIGPENELQKYHGWQCLIDVGQVDSRDVPLVAEYLTAIKPVYTNPTVVAALYLLDSIEFEDEVLMESTLHHFDDLAFSREATHMLDDYNGSGLPLRIIDIGSFSTRTWFAGTDLVMTAGSGTVSSVRGGFTTDGTQTPNSSFSDALTVVGEPLVRVGDILYIPDGPNVGRYEITTVTDDNTLVVTNLASTWPPRSIPPAQFVNDRDRRFYIERLDTNPIMSGTAMSTTALSAVVEDATATFDVDLVAVDDVLVIEGGADYGTYRIMQVGTALGTDMGTKLVLDSALTATASGITYRIERDAYRTNPVFTATDGAGTAANYYISTATGGVTLARLPAGAILTVVSSTGTGNLVGEVFTVIDTTDNNLYVSRALPASDSGMTVSVEIPDLYTDHPDADFAYELKSPYDEVELEVFYSLAAHAVGLVSDLSLSGSTATSAGTNFTVAGVTTSMFLEVTYGKNVTSLTGTATFTNGSTAVVGVGSAFLTEVAAGDLVKLDADGEEAWAEVLSVTDNLNLVLVDDYSGTGGGPGASSVAQTCDSTGVYAITNVAAGVLTVDEELHTETVVSAYVLAESTDFTLNAATATHASTDLEAAGVLPGDIFRYSGGDYVIQSVSTTALTLTQTTGVVATAYAGKIIRRL